MNFIKKEWPLVTSAIVFAGVMIVDYHMGFMGSVTSLTSGRASELFLSSGLLTVATLAFLEGILGIDNATVLAIQVRHLKPADAHHALTWGVWGAFIFRFVFLIAAGFILEQKWIMAVGGYYLVHMAGDFFLRNFSLLLLDLFFHGVFLCVFYFSGETVSKVPVWYVFVLLTLYAVFRYFKASRAATQSSESEEGIKISRFNLKNFPVLSAVIAVEWTDILFSFDSIGAGVAMTRDFWVLFWGAFFGVTCLRLFAKSFIKLLDRFPQLEGAAMLAVLIVGLKMAFESAQDSLKLRLYHIENWQTSIVIVIIFSAALLVRTKTPKITAE